MSRSNSAETNYLLLLFNNTNWANIGDTTGLRNSVGVGNFHVSLHTADPGEAGTQTISEATFGSYARQVVIRSGAGWTIAGNNVSNAAPIAFPTASSGSQTITHVGIGTDLSGAGNLLWSGAVSPPRLVELGVTLSFVTGALDINTD